MHQLTYGAVLAILFTLMPVGTAVAQSSPGTSAAPNTAEVTAVATRPTVRLLEPGGEPRRALRYALTVGQTDHFVISTRAASDVGPPDGPTPWPDPITALATADQLRATAEQTVLAAVADGLYDLETVYTDVELVSGGSHPEVDDVLGSQVRALAGTTTHQTIDDRGRVLSARTTTGPEWAASGIHLGIMPGLIDVNSLQLSRLLPDEPVGVGAVWQVMTEVLGPFEGRPLAVVVTTTLEQLHPDGSFELSSEGRLGAPAQRLAPPGSDHVALVIRTAGDLSARWSVDPTTFSPDGGVSVQVVETTTPTAKGVDPWAIAVHMETRTERLAEE